MPDTNARDELAEALRNEGAWCGSCDFEMGSDCPDCDNVLCRYADTILAAGYRKPRTITTTEELAELPVGAVVRDSDDCALQKELEESTLTPWRWGERFFSDSKVRLPALVLWTPEVDQ